MPEPLLLAISTPYARRGELYRAHRDHYGREDDRVLVWNADSLTMHPGAENAAFVESEFARDPLFAASEYGQGGSVQFRADVESFVDPLAVEAAVIVGRFELPFVTGTRYVAFADPAGGSGGDSYTLAIAHEAAGVSVLDCVREIQPRFSPDEATVEHSRVLRTYGLHEVTGDHFAGDFPRELFRKQGITYRLADAPVTDIYREWLPLLNARRCELLDNARLKNQLVALERKVAFGGKDTIGHPPGGHDDIANAVSGALVLAARYRRVTISLVAI